MPKISKAILLTLINGLEKNPADKVRILAEAGIVGPIIIVGTPPVAVASISIIGSVFGLPAAIKLFGWSVAFSITGPPLALTIGCAAVVGWLAFAAARLIRGGGLVEGRKAELLVRYREMLRDIEAKERSDTITPEDRTQFIISLRELIDSGAIPIGSAFRVVEMVERGRMPLSQAIAMTQACLEGRMSSKLTR